MAKIFLYNTSSGTLEAYYRGENEPMPAVSGSTLLVREFRGSSRSQVLWTTRQAMNAWNTTRAQWGQPIYVGYAFKRIWEGGHSNTSQHYAGVAFDVGQNLTSAQRRRLRDLASSLGVWRYVEPGSMTPTWIHFDRRYGTPACGRSSGYPTLREGSVGAYVLILQDALNALGFSTRTLDGRFGANTASALRSFQKRYGLSADGVAGCATWRALTSRAVGIGRTSTVID